ncbi:BTB/POZ domain-containing protein At3g22104-like [Gastrolobium bilobum]|uniref:BTB/POZ domain-containing protein At3g22104-like n=1 Tax=Gastrolobium bilobum TaxID=150636 RepID=UPI002AB2FC01|nr:BTB/POZ domain-containing protein At3g22104-like [Gastrolobium bilobum]
MGSSRDLEVNINGEESFMVDKNILSSFSRKFSNLIGNLEDKNGGQKVIINDFPGGAHGFELIVELCNNSNRIKITPSNVALLCSAAHFLEMECDHDHDHDLVTPSFKHRIENFLEGIRIWTWCELLEALKQCQELFSSKSCLATLERILDHLMESLTLHITSLYTSSAERSSIRFSCDTSSASSCRNNSSGTTWWFKHLLFLKIVLLDKMIRIMISHDFDHGILSKFLFYYRNLSCVCAARAGRIEITEVVINLLTLLDMKSVSWKDLFDLYRIATGLRLSRVCKNKIEGLVVPLLHHATIDYLLLPSPRGSRHAYDVDSVLRLMHKYYFGGSTADLTLSPIKRVAKMMDLFLAEVAPDPHLKPSEFEALITVLPDTARESHDQLYQTMDMYLKVHAGVGDKEKMSICRPLKHEKLSPKLLRHLRRNLLFPSETKLRAHVTKRCRMKTLFLENYTLKNFFDSMLCKTFKKMDVEEILRGVLEGMRSGNQLACEKKSGIHIESNGIHLPKL